MLYSLLGSFEKSFLVSTERRKMAEKTKITRIEYVQLQARLAEVSGLLQRAHDEKSAAHQSAGDPDIHENFAAEEALERIRMWSTEEMRLKRQLAQSEVIDIPQEAVSDGIIRIGCTVVLLLDDTDTITKVFSGPQGRFDKGQIASTSDIGKAIDGKLVGTETTYTSKSGLVTKVKILEVRHDGVPANSSPAVLSTVTVPVSHHL